MKVNHILIGVLILGAFALFLRVRQSKVESDKVPKLSQVEKPRGRNITQLTSAEQKIITQQMYRMALSEGFRTDDFLERSLVLHPSSNPAIVKVRWPSRGGDCILFAEVSSDLKKIYSTSSQCR